MGLSPAKPTAPFPLSCAAEMLGDLVTSTEFQQPVKQRSSVYLTKIRC